MNTDGRTLYCHCAHAKVVPEETKHEVLRRRGPAHHGRAQGERHCGLVHAGATGEAVLHGGATAALAESVGSFASHIFIDLEQYFVRGLEITANHLKSVKAGYIYAKATFLQNKFELMII